MFQQLLTKIANALDRLHIGYMIIGGQAVLLYGEPRLTRDIDITLGMGVEGFARIADLVHELALKILVDDPEAFARKTMVLPVIEETTGIRVDFIFSHSPYEEQAITRAREVQFGAKAVKFASLEDVVIHKIIAGRGRDIDDVKAILLKNPDYDKDYIARWLKEFDLSLQEDFIGVFRKIVRKIA